eukprot:scaffold2950_cov67-Phaeocystis_antarctica.AAC.5
MSLLCVGSASACGSTVRIRLRLARVRRTWASCPAPQVRTVSSRPASVRHGCGALWLVHLNTGPPHPARGRSASASGRRRAPRGTPSSPAAAGARRRRRSRRPAPTPRLASPRAMPPLSPCRVRPSAAGSARGSLARRAP